MLPADALLLENTDFFIQQSSLTGESESVEKTSIWVPDEEKKRENKHSRANVSSLWVQTLSAVVPYGQSL